MFGERRDVIDKHSYRCKECDALAAAAYRNTPRGKETLTIYYTNHWERERIKSAKKRAKSQNLPFNITGDYIKSITPPDMMCPALGIQMKAGEKAEIAKVSSPSLDRLIPELGYVKGNIVIVSNRANTIKRDATPEELMKIAKFYEKVFKEQNPRQLALDL
jgi:hypothetical protein